MGRFRAALASDGLAAIAEVKRRSPSAGDLRPDADPARLAAQFAAAGAAAVSILVDERFAGSVDDLRAARAATPLPLLAKGFFRDEAQLRELREAGADAVLLILRDLDDATAARLQTVAHELVARAAKAACQQPAPRDRVVVAESAIHTRAQGAAAELAGADAILVGSALMRAPDPPAKLAEILSRPLVKVCGLTRQEDVDAAVEAGAGQFGFILAETPRREPVARVVDLPWEQADPLHLHRAAAAEGRVVLAGRLGPDNVRAAIEAVRPWAVDAASRLEREPGIKDHDKVRAFVRCAR